MFEYDFSGWATRNDVLCSDGRTIRKDAFKHQDGETIPLVWNHEHGNLSNVLGHAKLENRDKGVYAYCSFNNTDMGRSAKEMVSHGDITSLSIYANKLKQVGGNVVHGDIKEVSIVLAGANPEAHIDSIMSHGDEESDSAIIYNGHDGLFIAHSYEHDEHDENDKENGDDGMGNYYEKVIDSMTNEQREVLYDLVDEALQNGNSEKYEDEDEEPEYYEDEDEDNEEDDSDMKHNLFDNEEHENTNVLSHSDIQKILEDGKRMGSLKDSFLAHTENTQTYGISPNIDYLFPDYKSLNGEPEFIKRDTDWAGKVMNSVHHTPFSRIKSVFADITEPEARAKGYLKGHQKTYEVFGLLKRTTDSQTIYKKQKLDRDDIIDITDFDVVAWLKSEMRLMLDEEIARAILVGDDRLSSSDDKISEDHIRSVWKDNVLYAPKYVVAGTAQISKAKAFIQSIIRARKDYKGSGNPTLYTTEEMLTEMLLLEDGIGHFLYPNAGVLATTLRVKEIVTVPVMSEITHARHDSTANKDYLPIGIVVNLTDYNVGADKGGAVNLFDDFDIDYNQQKYLIETRCSGALVKPKSALVFEEEYVNP